MAISRSGNSDAYFRSFAQALDHPKSIEKLNKVNKRIEDETTGNRFHKTLVEKEVEGIFHSGEFFSLEKRKKGMIDLGKRLNVMRMEDWYDQTVKNVRRRGGRVLIRLFGESLQVALTELFPEYPWKPWLFSHIPERFWNVESHRRDYLRWLEEVLNIKKVPTDWYRVKSTIVISQHGGIGFLHHYGNSLRRALADLYPDQDWYPWLFEGTGSYFWTSRENRLRFLEWLSHRLHIEELDDWYRVKVEEVLANDGSTFLERYQGSLQKALADLIPEHPWQSWRFTSTWHGFWKLRSNRYQYLSWLAEKLNVVRMDDWSFVSREQIKHYKGSSIINRRGGFRSLLTELMIPLGTIRNGKETGKYRDSIDNDSVDSSRNLLQLYQTLYRMGISSSSLHLSTQLATGICQLSKAQHFVFRSIQQLFPETIILSNCNHRGFRFSREMELDIFLPSLSLAIEYHGQQHYHWVFRFGSPDSQRKRDEEKRMVIGKIRKSIF